MSYREVSRREEKEKKMQQKIAMFKILKTRPELNIFEEDYS